MTKSNIKMEIKTDGPIVHVRIDRENNPFGLGRYEIMTLAREELACLAHIAQREGLTLPSDLVIKPSK